MDELINKEQFLAEHNKLSPAHLQTTFAGLTLFQLAKKPLLKDSEWSFKLRIPFILWLGTLPPPRKKSAKKLKEPIYKIYPQTYKD